jgi:hypothetical protein
MRRFASLLTKREERVNPRGSTCHSGLTAANGYIAGQLFGVTPRDPVAIVVALSVLGIVTMVAGYVPAPQASRIDPVRALRTE